MEIKDNLKYTENHEWVCVEGNIATVGITDYAQRELGDIVYIDVDSIGQDMHVDDIFGSVEAVKTVSDLFMPISGKIIEFNDKLESNPELLNQDPYEAGWIIKVELQDLNDNNELLSSEQYKSIIGAE